MLLTIPIHIFPYKGFDTGSIIAVVYFIPIPGNDDNIDFFGFVNFFNL